MSEVQRDGEMNLGSNAELTLYPEYLEKPLNSMKNFLKNRSVIIRTAFYKDYSGRSVEGILEGDRTGAVGKLLQQFRQRGRKDD